MLGKIVKIVLLWHKTMEAQCLDKSLGHAKYGLTYSIQAAEIRESNISKATLENCDGNRTVACLNWPPQNQWCGLQRQRFAARGRREQRRPVGNSNWLKSTLHNPKHSKILAQVVSSSKLQEQPGRMRWTPSGGCFCAGYCPLPSPTSWSQSRVLYFAADVEIVERLQLQSKLSCQVG